MNLDQLRDELAAKHTRLCSKQILPGSWIDGWNALLKVLSEVAGELPSKQIAQEAIEKYPDCTYRMQGYLAGRREQFDQDRARIGLAEFEFGFAQGEIKELEARLAESEQVRKEDREHYETVVKELAKAEERVKELEKHMHMYGDKEKA